MYMCMLEAFFVNTKDGNVLAPLTTCSLNEWHLLFSLDLFNNCYAHVGVFTILKYDFFLSSE